MSPNQTPSAAPKPVCLSRACAFPTPIQSTKKNGPLKRLWRPVVVQFEIPRA
jgi:hypothetical protein